MMPAPGSHDREAGKVGRSRDRCTERRVQSREFVRAPIARQVSHLHGAIQAGKQERALRRFEFVRQERANADMTALAYIILAVLLAKALVVLVEFLINIYALLGRLNP